MAKVLLERIGSPLESIMDIDGYKKNLGDMQKLNQRYILGRDEIRAG
jgi:hypothetical protein